MKVKTLHIHWHDKMAIYSIDFEPPQPSAQSIVTQSDSSSSSPSEQQPPKRFATAAADHNIRIWRLIAPQTSALEHGKDPEPHRVEFMATLNRHTAVVNCVRWAPQGGVLASCGDAGGLMLWHKPDCSHGDSRKETKGSLEDADDDNKEQWKIKQVMRGCSADMYDLSWSHDAALIAVACIDNSFRIWDVQENRLLQVISDHNYFVQGIAFDPLGRFLATQSGDRTVNVYQYTYAPPKPGSQASVSLALVGKHSKTRAKQPSRPQTLSLIGTPTLRPTMDLDYPANDTPNPAANNKSAAPLPHESDTMEIEERQSSELPRTTPTTPAAKSSSNHRLFHDETLLSFFRRLQFSLDGALLVTPAGLYKDNQAAAFETKELELKNTAYIFARGQISSDPIMHLPGHKKPTNVVKFCPILFKERPGTNPEEKWVDLPYRLVFAVVSLDAVIIYDTHQRKPLALIGNLHYGSITDVAWTHDGQSLLLCATDGFCSLVQFTPDELGPSSFSTPSIPAPCTLQSDQSILNAATLSQEKVLQKLFEPDTVMRDDMIPPAAPIILPSISEMDVTVPLPAEQPSAMNKENVKLLDPSAIKKRRITPTFVGPLATQ